MDDALHRREKSTISISTSFREGQVKSVPYTPVSHPFVERMIRTIREELLDQVLFWNLLDLERKPFAFQIYYNP